MVIGPCVGRIPMVVDGNRYTVAIPSLCSLHSWVLGCLLQRREAVEDLAPIVSMLTFMSLQTRAVMRDQL